jgi:hypothetical protein
MVVHALLVSRRGGISMITPGMGLDEMLRDPDEGPHLRHCLPQFRPGSWVPPRRPQEYIDLLKGTDGLRAAFLELLEAEGGRGPDAGQRYQELVRLLQPFGDWVWVVAKRHRVRNCGRAVALPQAVRFQFRCPRQWETLAATPETGVRFCDSCQQNVYYCDTTQAVEMHARRGDCITVPQQVADSAGTEVTWHITGRPDYEQLWAERVFGREPLTRGKHNPRQQAAAAGVIVRIRNRPTWLCPVPRSRDAYTFGGSGGNWRFSHPLMGGVETPTLARCHFDLRTVGDGTLGIDWRARLPGGVIEGPHFILVGSSEDELFDPKLNLIHVRRGDPRSLTEAFGLASTVFGVYVEEWCLPQGEEQGGPSA